MSSPGTVISFVPGRHTHLIPYIAAIHASVITHDRTLATFLPPLSHEKLLTWWKERIAEIDAGTRLIWILIRDVEGNDVPPSSAALKGPEVVGVCMLAMPFSETGAFRASVEKLLVHSSWRGKGGARRLMEVLEREASSRGRTMITLDTETGSPAEQVYVKLGYTEVGRIPKYGMSPTGELKDGTFFYKQLEV